MSTENTTAIASKEKVSRHPRLEEFLFSAKRFLKNPLTILGLVIILGFAVVALLAPVLAPPERADNPYQMPHDGWRMDPSPPSKDHIFGTLPQQFDIFYGLVWGTRNAFKIGFLIVLANLVIGVTLGAVAGYFGGAVDEVIMRITDMFYAMPFLVVAMAIVVVIGKGLTSIVLVLVLLGWRNYTRVIRAEIMIIRDRDYIQAARASGAGHLSIIFRHVLPNSIYSVLIVASMNIGTTVLTAAALSFLGLGADVGYADWGAMVSLARNWIVGPPSARLYYWFVVFIPGFTIALFVLGWNLLGDAARDVFDPKQRRR